MFQASFRFTLDTHFLDSAKFLNVRQWLLYCFMTEEHCFSLLWEPKMTSLVSSLDSVTLLSSTDLYTLPYCLVCNTTPSTSKANYYHTCLVQSSDSRAGVQ